MKPKAIDIHAAVELDGPQIRSLTAQIELFNPEEVACVEELWNEYRFKGMKTSGYHFLIARHQQQVVGFACYGLRPLTHGAYDLYWIAVSPEYKRQGIGRQLLERVEQDIRLQGGRLIFVETSGQPKYQPARDFYLGTGYEQEATIREFYKPGDDLVIFTKRL